MTIVLLPACTGYTYSAALAVQLITGKGFGINDFDQYVAAPGGSISLDVAQSRFDPAPISGVRERLGDAKKQSGWVQLECALPYSRSNLRPSMTIKRRYHA